jgi:hypothetical protein
MFMKRKQIIAKCENKLDPHVASYQTPVGPFNQETIYNKHAVKDSILLPLLGNLCFQIFVSPLLLGTILVLIQRCTISML